MIRRAYEVVDLDVSDTGYVECHGTGTPMGDPIETKAVARVFGEAGVIIGSTKPNFGHTKGVSSILTVLKDCKLALAEEPLFWPEGRLERVSLNSFGLGGTNAHAIIDSAASYKAPAGPRIEEAAQILLYSASTQQSLTTPIGNYKTFIGETALNVEDVAYTLTRGREHLPYHAFAIANGSSVGAASPITKPGQQKPKIAMVLTGQGAQWHQMGGDLLKSNPTFRSSIRLNTLH
ncbi:uncharacterized protein ASPGLDRAFT_31800 [Aspergillus glaucus CBS 516.65]|uniref:Ketosynthase family 3 (KS3) domain-containing protein n=1 Tax=Aspergillus glaucus CBS 516.65 TaxID=1160497 RepID=A0A1L9VXP2_ASPGL|nr:hypothetical protein ASPGLDRAFT_31800 [Aspergillus glaucus CBS 516.65]OJJ88681.1 hypothetical protein ASPGLDRAFT_31800 [Aspergillus glaucus CBS 516.65]